MYAHAQLLGITGRREHLIYLSFQAIPFRAVDLFVVSKTSQNIASVSSVCGL